MMREKKLSTAGAEIVGALAEFRDTLEEGPEAVERKYTVRTVELKLEPRTYTGQDVERVRKMLGLSQALFARFLGVSVNAVRKWETGGKPPSGVACRFLEEISLRPEYWKSQLRELIVNKSKGTNAGHHVSCQ